MRRSVLAVAAMAVILAAAVSVRAAGHPASRQDPEPPFDAMASKDADAAVFRKVCVECHPADRIVSARHTAFEWQETMEKMLTKGAKGTDEELQTVFRFLVKRFGKVNINIAPADEIAAVLSLPDAQGEAIVRYRAAQGRFADLDSVRKVPGLETARLNPDTILFE